MSHTMVIAEKARAFLAAYDTLDRSMYEMVERDGMRFKLPIHGRFSAIAPAMTCLLFSAELVLKALTVQLDGGRIAASPKGHDLKKLFNDLPSEMRQEIAGKLGRSLYSVDQSLNEHERAFEKWRYSYEGDGAWADETFLKDFVKAALSRIDLP